MSLIDRALDCSVGGRGVDSRGQINTQGLSDKINVLSLTCKRLDHGVALMTTSNSDPNSSWRHRSSVAN